MPIQLEESGPNQVRIVATVPAEEVQRAFRSTWNEVRRHVRMPGFRPGKVPDRILEKHFGDRIRRDTKERLVQEAFQSAIDEHGLKPLEPPEIDLDRIPFDANGEFRFELDVLLRPRFEAPDPRDIHVGAPPVRVADDDVERELDALRRSHARLEEVEDGICAKGDVLGVDVSYRVDGAIVVHHEGRTADTGTGRVDDIDVGDAVSAFLGKGPGAEVVVPARLPDDFEPSGLAGADAQLLCSIRSIRRLTVPELDEEFARAVGADSLDDLRGKLRESLVRRMEDDRDRFVEERIFDELLSRVEIAVPPRLLDRAVDDTLARMREHLVRRGADDAQARAEAASRAEEVRRDEERALKISFLLEAIAEKENIEVSEKDIEAAVRSLAALHRRPPQEVFDELADSGRLGGLRARVLEGKVRRFLREAAVIEESEPAPEEAGAEGAE